MGLSSHAPLERVGVIGGGIMGTGISEVCAREGLDVVLVEINPERRRPRSGELLERSLDRAVSRGKARTRSGGAHTLDGVLFTSDIKQVADRQIVIEAVIEDKAAKLEVSRASSRGLVEDREAILASNTSSIPIVELAAEYGDRGKGT